MLPLEVFKQWNFVEDLMVFGQNFSENDKFWYLNPILEKLGLTLDLGWWRVRKPMVDFVILC